MSPPPKKPRPPAANKTAAADDDEWKGQLIPFIGWLAQNDPTFPAWGRENWQNIDPQALLAAAAVQPDWAIDLIQPCLTPSQKPK